MNLLIKSENSMFVRITLFSLISFFSFNAVASKPQPEIPTDYSKVLLRAVLAVIKDCYKGPKQTTGDQLVKCVAAVFVKEVPNPQFYKINITGDCPGDIDLIMYNIRGNMINCYITLAESITVNRCISYKIPPLTKGQEMSITTPEVLVK